MTYNYKDNIHEDLTDVDNSPMKATEKGQIFMAFLLMFWVYFGVFERLTEPTPPLYENIGKASPSRKDSILTQGRFQQADEPCKDKADSNSIE